MTTHLVTFSDESMSRSRNLCVDSATDYGVDGITWAYAASEVDKAAGRGLGFWAWKPRIILDFLTDTTGGLAHPDDGDILIYADAGVEFINNVNYIIDRMDQDIFLFGNNWEHAHWCKADVLMEVMPLSFHWRALQNIHVTLGRIRQTSSSLGNLLLRLWLHPKVCKRMARLVLI